MSLRYASGSLVLIAGMVMLPVAQAAPQSCMTGKPTPASYTWNFHAEAARLLSGIRLDATKAHDRADKLDTYAYDDSIDWQLHANQLNALSGEVNDMAQKLCRLEQIRRVTAPWQQKAIEEAAVSVRLMADNVQDAINFVNEYHRNLWEPAYRLNVSNVLQQSGQLAQSLETFGQYAKVRREATQLKSELGLGAKS